MMQIIKQLIITSRPFYWLFSIIFIFGFWYSGASVNLIGVLMFMMTIPSTLLLFGINDIADYKYDKKNPRKKNILFGSVLDKQYHDLIWKVSFVITAILILLSVLSFSYTTFFSTFVCLFIVYAYSLEPIRLKSKPFMEVLSCLVGGFALLLMGYGFGGGAIDFFNKFGVSRVLVISSTMLAVALQSYLADYEADLESNQQTTVHIIGPRKTIVISAFLYLIASFFVETFFLKVIFYFLFFESLSPLFFEKLFTKVRVYHHSKSILITALIIFVILNIYV
jgi:4-hydroxybenzoate polyprenyltransferase